MIPVKSIGDWTVRLYVSVWILCVDSVLVCTVSVCVDSVCVDSVCVDSVCVWIVVDWSAGL